MGYSRPILTTTNRTEPNMKLTLLFSLLFTCSLMAQHTVTGLVTDGTEPLIGASVLVKDQSTTGTATDIDGRYTLSIPDPSATLVFTYVGYDPLEVAVAGRTELDVDMGEQATTLQELVVVGYGIQRKSDLTGAISSVKAEDIQRIPTPDVGQALQGKIAGVQVTPSSGQPGASAVIRIRGTGTLNNASPLFVVDGMLLDDIGFLNPNDVESIEVLKDASATAIYGSRGANGVIIVTTKRGEAGRTVFSFNSYVGTQEVIDRIELTNAREYALLSNELATNEGRPPVFADPAAFGEGTDWQDLIFRSAPIQSYQIGASGGTERMRFNLSVGYFTQEGIVRGSEFDRLTVRINNDYNLTNWLTVGHNVSLIHTNNVFAPGVVNTAYRADPTVAPFDSLGNFSNTTANAPVGNAEASLFYLDDNTNTNFRTVGNAYVEAQFLQDFRFRSNVGIDLGNTRSKNYVPVFFVSPIQQNQENNLFVAFDRARNILWENTLTYNKEWERHRLTALGGITAQDFTFENIGGSRRNFPGDTEEFFFLSAGEETTQTNFNGGSSSSILSYLGRVNYVFDDKYLLTVSMRADGSSKFGSENRYGYFPSAAVGWNMTTEPWLESQNLVSRLKLRASWGQIGNDKIGAYAGRPVVTGNLNTVFGQEQALQPGASIVSLANTGIRWEETTQTDIGFELGLLDNRFTAEVDYYNRTTDDILVSVPIPDFIGAANDPIVNAASVRNRGIDFNLQWRDAVGDFSYSFGLLGSTIDNEVLSLGQGKEELFGGGLGVGGLLGTRTTVGSPIGAFYGYNVVGVYQNEAQLTELPGRGDERVGDLIFEDTNNDGMISSDDRTMIGNPIPDFVYGFDASFGYKGFDFNVAFNGVSGNELINAKKIARFGTPNFETSFLDRWTPDNPSDTEPRITNGGRNYEPSTRFIEDGSFLRLRNLQLGYTLPTAVLERIRATRLRVYVGGTNLVTWTDYSGYTPEINSENVLGVGIDRGIFPPAKTYTVGLDLTF